MIRRHGALAHGDPRHQPVPHGHDCGCECHKINWLKILEKGDYEMVDGSPVQIGVSCEDKVENNHMSEEYFVTRDVDKHIFGLVVSYRKLKKY